MLIWLSILLLCDAGFALLFERRIHPLMPKINIKTVAIIEAATALLLVFIHFARAS